MTSETRVLAVDWSGKLSRPEQYIWLAEVRDGQLHDLRNGLSREEVVAELIGLCKDEPRTVIGLDFAFSFPEWWCSEQGWAAGREVWAAIAEQGEEILAGCAPPFWGRTGKSRTIPKEKLFRRTELEEGAVGAKSVFQIGGAGAVGTGSIRGMPHLRTLADEGFSVWPFTEAGWPRLVEIYPRTLTGQVNKGSWTDRHDLLFKRFPEQPAELLERAAGSEDAFDAAVSALVMYEHRDDLKSLAEPPQAVYRLEGKIWCPD